MALVSLNSVPNLRRQVRRVNENFKQIVARWGIDSSIAQDFLATMDAGGLETHRTASGNIAINYQQEAGPDGKPAQDVRQALAKLDKLGTSGMYRQQLLKDYKAYAGLSDEDIKELLEREKKGDRTLEERLQEFNALGGDIHRFIENHKYSIYSALPDITLDLKAGHQLTPDQVERMYNEVKAYEDRQKEAVRNASTYAKAVTDERRKILLKELPFD